MKAQDIVLFETELVRCGRFCSRPGDVDFETAGRPPSHSWVFPQTGVWIFHHDHEPFVADPTRVTLYNPGQDYRRGKLSDKGDVCHWFSAEPNIIREALETIDPGLAENGNDRLFGRRWLPSCSPAYTLQHQLLRTIQEGPVDPLALEESVIRLLRRTLSTANTVVTRNPCTSLRKRRRDRDLVERTRALLAASFHDRLDLAGISSAVGSSVYHLCHVFRSQTGTTVHAYLTELRLRAALPELRAGKLTELALDLGFSSHSHFSHQFRRHFGMSPSQLRGRQHAGLA